ncbi:class I SAM-dependent methyltransferase [Natronococcus pandeyae]|uniref:Class I SAM-dependent methyltransferase n=1 Tax=Natronococcus pandeyae TaxID=2055836 RepID=A0A8J8TS91_9EURY|nr:class I SAM-dependent methyltransferase [Natronococcus pandeyae]TYL38272.1 class I SAM-dependent methyltransferase [Natronococcus pandeyae]
MDGNEVHDRWATRTGAYSPAYYAYYGPNETSELIRETLDRVVSPDADVLELGCSSGRHLAHLQEHGYENLYGVDINDEAFDVMERTYPDLAEAGTFYRAPLEDVVRDVTDDRFDVVYSVETLQHLHPDAEWVFDELIRLTETLLVTAETDAGSEGGSASPAETSVDDGDSSADLHHPGSTIRETRYVDGVPLYVRDWGRIFAERGWIELECDATSLEYHTVRAFRSPSN